MHLIVCKLGALLLFVCLLVQSAPGMIVPIPREGTAELTMEFDRTSIIQGNGATLIVTITNVSEGELDGLEFEIDLPAGLSFPDPLNASTTCGPVGGDEPMLEVDPTRTNFYFFGGTPTPTNSCVVRVPVTGDVIGDYTDTVVLSGAAGEFGELPDLTQSLSVLSPEVGNFNMRAFASDGVIEVGESSTLTFVFENTGTLDPDEVGFDLVLPPGLVFATPNNGLEICPFPGAPVAVDAGDGGTSYNYRTSAGPSPDEVCRFSVDVMATAVGN